MEGVQATLDGILASLGETAEMAVLAQDSELGGARRVRGTSIPVAELLVGHVFAVRPGERIPGLSASLCRTYPELFM